MGEDAVRHHLVHRFNQPSSLNMPGTQVPMYAQPCIELLTLERVGLLSLPSKQELHNLFMT